MGRLFDILRGGVLYACFATVVAVAVLLAVLAAKGRLNKDRIDEVALILLGQPRPTPDAAEDPAAEAVDFPTFRRTVERRLERELDNSLRAMVLDGAVEDFRVLEQELRVERDRYDALRRSFEGRLAELEQTTRDGGLRQLQETLETIRPRQAKDEIVRMLDDDRTRGDDRGLRDLVTILKSMPTDARKKIMAEFKTDDEMAQLHRVLRELRLGEPASSLVEQARGDLEGS